MSSPVHVERGVALIEGGKDERGSGEVIRRADDLSRCPAMVVQDRGRVVDVLDGVVGLWFFEDVGRRYAEGLGKLRHHVGFHEMVMGRTAGHDEARRNAGAVLAHTFQDALTLLGRRSTVRLGRSSQHDDGVEVMGRRIVCGQDGVAAVEGNAANNNKKNEQAADELHGMRVTGAAGDAER